jgi:hypothetical protein
MTKPGCDARTSQLSGREDERAFREDEAEGRVRFLLPARLRVKLIRR